MTKEEKQKERENKLLEALAKEKEEKEELQEQIYKRDEDELKEKDPMSGPGKMCEVTKITLSEAWQLKSREVINPQTQTEEMATEPAPEGYVKRLGPNNGYFVVKKGDEVLKTETGKSIHLKDVVFPNCRSKYTREYSVFDKKPREDKGNFKKEPPRYNLYMCEKHAKMFGARDRIKNPSK